MTIQSFEEIIDIRGPEVTLVFKKISKNKEFATPLQFETYLLGLLGLNYQ